SCCGRRLRSRAPGAGCPPASSAQARARADRDRVGRRAAGGGRRMAGRGGPARRTRRRCRERAQGQADRRDAGDGGRDGYHVGAASEGAMEKLKPVRRSALSGPVIIVPDELTNSLLIRAAKDDYDVLVQAVGELDIRPLQVL